MKRTSLTTIRGVEGRADNKGGWHKWFDQSFWTEGWSVVDIGSGLGRIKERVRNVVTSDCFPGCEDFVDMPFGTIYGMPHSVYDYVTAFGVISHIKSDIEFLEHCCAVAKKGVFITAPNYLVSECNYEYHYREYLPQQFVQLCEQMPIKLVQYYAGSLDGETISGYSSSEINWYYTNRHSYLGAFLLK